MPADPSNAADAAWKPLIDALAAKLLPLVEERIQSVIGEQREAVQASPQKRLLSLRDLARRYGVGRIQAKADIVAGKLRVVERRCAGGRIGTFIPIEEAERQYAGVRK